MRALLVVGFYLFGLSFVYAQPNNVLTAYMYLSDNDLAKAKTAIEAATEHDKTSTSAKTWYYAGKIYMAIYRECDKTGDNFEGYPADYYLGLAKNAYYKATTFDMSRIDEKQLKLEYQITGDYMLNEGVALYNKEAFERAAMMFEGTILVKKDFQITDSLAYYNAALAHEKAGNLDKAAAYYLDCGEMGYNGAIAYSSAAAIRKSQGKDNDAMQIIRTGREKYPTDQSLLISDINMLLRAEEYEKALFTIDQALISMPENADLHFSRGTLLEASNISEAITAYKRAIEINPNHVNALYNLGAAYYNMAVDMRNAENATNETAVEELKIARTYLEKVESLSPGNATVAESLGMIEAILGQ
ncbi:MAG: hypothetical protein Crog4KO_24380 [Crocinitomicaceae bacterium]